MQRLGQANRVASSYLDKEIDLTPQVNRIALIPAYNEARFIGSVVLEALLHVDLVLVVDDGSTDNTSQIAQSAGASVIQMPHNAGKAEAVQVGLAAAAPYSPKVIVMLDGDGQHNAAEIPHVIAPILDESTDLVIGSRFQQIESDIPQWRQVGQHALTWVTNKSSGTHSTDSQSGFRAFSAATLPLFNFQTNGFSIESEMQFIAHEHNLRVTEVPISVVYAEPAKRNPVAHGLQVLNGIMKLVGMNRPLLFFGIPGSVSLSIGTFIGLWIVRIYQQSAELAVGYGLLSILLLIVGTTTISTAIILHSLRAWLYNWAKHK